MFSGKAEHSEVGYERSLLIRSYPLPRMNQRSTAVRFENKESEWNKSPLIFGPSAVVRSMFFNSQNIRCGPSSVALGPTLRPAITAVPLFFYPESLALSSQVTTPARDLTHQSSHQGCGTTVKAAESWSVPQLADTRYRPKAASERTVAVPVKCQG